MATDAGAKETVRVVVVEEHDLVRRGLVAWLKGEPDMEVVGQAHDGAGAHSEVRRTVPDVVLLDVHTSPFADPLPPDLYADAESPRGGSMDLFTGRARRAVVRAEEEARLLNHDHIGTEHLLLGVIRDGVAAKALESVDISFETVREQVEGTVGAGQPPTSGHIPFAPGARKVLEFSLREAHQLGHNYIDTEHILLGLIRQDEGVAAQVLIKLGKNLSRVRELAIRLLLGVSEPTESHDWVSVLRGLRDAFPTVGIVALLSVDASPEIASIALKAGATTYVSKIDPMQTVFALRVAANMNKPEA